MGHNDALISDQEKLNRALMSVRSVIGVDTEFVSRSTFFARPALIQISTAQQCYLIDLVAPLNLAELQNLIVNPAVSKVMHAPQEDVDLLYFLWGVEPQNLQDVQLAHSFLEPEHSVSYSGLVHKYLDQEVNPNSKITSSNWLRRPLSSRQMTYAVNDVKYLIPMWSVIKHRLTEEGRLTWYEEEMKTIKSSLKNFSLRGHWSSSLSQLRSKIDRDYYLKLLEWREREARDQNTPRKWIASNQQLIDAARMQDSSLQIFEKEFPRKVGCALHRAILSIKNQSEDFGQFQGQTKVLSNQKTTVLMRRVRKLITDTAADLNLSVVRLGAKPAILSWIQHFHSFGTLPNSFGLWREQLIGDRVRTILQSI